MELDITEFFRNATPRDYSASAGEIGQDAGRITWGHACEDAPEYPILDTEEKREAFRAFVRSSGGWDDEGIRAWSDNELSALLIQWISGDMRECEIGPNSTDAEWHEYERLAMEGVCSSRLFRGSDGRVYFYIGE